MKPKLSREAKARLDLAGKMMADVLQRGGIPEIVIAAKQINSKTHELDYLISSPLKRDELRYVLSRVLALLDGRIEKGN